MAYGYPTEESDSFTPSDFEDRREDEEEDRIPLEGEQESYSGVPPGLVLDQQPQQSGLPLGMVLDEPYAASDKELMPDTYKIDYNGPLYPAIAQQRQQLVSEIDNNPRLKEYFAAALSQEAGDPDAVLGVVESLFNRTQQRKSSIAKQLTNGFYGPVNRGEVDRIVKRGVEPWMYEQAERALNAVRNGSNLIEGRTDQGMYNEIIGPRAKYGREYFGYMGGDPTWSIQFQRNIGEPGPAYSAPGKVPGLVPLKEGEQRIAGVPPGMVLDKPESQPGVPPNMVLDAPVGSEVTSQQPPSDQIPATPSGGQGEAPSETLRGGLIEWQPTPEQAPGILKLPRLSPGVARKMGLEQWIDQDTGREVRRAEMAEDGLPIRARAEKPEAKQHQLGINIPVTRAEAAAAEAEGKPYPEALLPKEKPKAPSKETQSDWIDAGNSFMRGASSDGGLLSLGEGLYDIVAGRTKDMPWLKTIHDNAVKQRDAVAAMRERVQKRLPVDKSFHESYAGQIYSGLGQLTNLPIYVAAGAIGGPGTALAAGGVITVGQLWQEAKDDYKETAKQKGFKYNEADADKAATQYIAAAAPLEVLADYTIIGKFLGGAVAKRLTVGEVIRQGAKTFGTEGTTEAAQQAWNNYVARVGTKYDPERPFTQGVADSFWVGGAVGGIAGAGGTIVQPRVPPGVEAGPKAPVVPGVIPKGTLTGAAAEMGAGKQAAAIPFTPPGQAPTQAPPTTEPPSPPPAPPPGEGGTAVAAPSKVAEAPSAAPIEPTEEVQTTKSSVVRDSEDRKGEVVKEEEGGRLTVDWEDGTQSVVNEDDVNRTVKEKTVYKNAVMLVPTTGKGVQVHYYNNEGKKTSKTFKSEDKAIQHATQIVTDNNLSGYSDVDDNFVRLAGTPVETTTTTEPTVAAEQPVAPAPVTPVTPAPVEPMPVPSKGAVKAGVTGQQIFAKESSYKSLPKPELEARVQNIVMRNGKTFWQRLMEKVPTLLPKGIPIKFDYAYTTGPGYAYWNNGAASFGINPTRMLAEYEAMKDIDPKKAEQYLEDFISEEETHLADFISNWNRWQNLSRKQRQNYHAVATAESLRTGEPVDGFDAFMRGAYTKLVTDLRDMSAGLPQDERNKVAQLLVDAWNAYVVHQEYKESRIAQQGGYVGDPQGIYDFLIDKGHGGVRDVGLLMEVTRQVRQAWKAKSTSESTLAQIMQHVEQWFRDTVDRILKTLSESSEANRVLRAVFQPYLDQIDQVFKDAELRKITNTGHSAIDSSPQYSTTPVQAGKKPAVSKELREFLGNTVTKDKDGNSQIQYHWHRKDIDEFTGPTNDLGYHVGTAKAAYDRAMQVTKGRIENALGNVTMPLHVRLENPAYIPDLGDWAPPYVAAALRQGNYITSREEAELVSRYGEITNHALKRMLQSKGYDGIAYINTEEGRRKLTPEEANRKISESRVHYERRMMIPTGTVLIFDPREQVIGHGKSREEAETDARNTLTSRRHPVDYSYILFTSNQIKSARGNEGTYDFGNPKITKSKGALDMSTEAKIVEMHNATGGSSFNAQTGDVSGTDTYSVEVYPEITTSIPGKTLVVQDIIDLQDKLREKGIELNVPYLTIGTWVDEETGNSEIGVSALIPDLHTALEIAERYNQKAIWYNGIGATIFLQGVQPGVANLPSLGERTGFIAKKSAAPSVRDFPIFKPRISDPYSFNITNLPPGKVEAVKIISDADIVASAERGKDWRDWYTTWDRYMRWLTAKHPDYRPLSAWFFAATSPSNLVGANIAAHMRAFRNFVETGDPGISFDAMEAHQFNLRRAVGRFPTGAVNEPTAVGGGIIGGGVGLSGGKVPEFAPALLGDPYAIAIDMHVASILFGTPAPTEWQRFAGQMAIMRISKRMGWSPAEVQAALFADHIMKQPKGVMARAEKYMRQYEEEFHRLIEADIEAGGQGAGIGRSILQRASERIGPERFLRTADGNIEAIRQARVVAIDPYIANRISLTGPRGIVAGAKGAAGPPNRVEVDDVSKDAAYMMDQSGNIYRVRGSAWGSRDDWLSHDSYVNKHLGIDLQDAQKSGWIRIITEPSIQQVIWDGMQASNAQMRSLKDMGAVTGFPVKRENANRVAAKGAAGTGRSSAGVPTTARDARIPSAVERMANFWDGTKQVLWNSPGLASVGDAVHRHTDLNKKYTGEFTFPFYQWSKAFNIAGFNINRPSQKQAMNEHQEWRAAKAGKQPLPALSKEGQKLKAVFDGVIAKINLKNSSLGLKVKHPITKKHVPIPFLDYPAKVQEKFMKAMRDKHANIDTWNQLRDDLIAENILPKGATDDQVQDHLDKVLAAHDDNSAFGNFFFHPGTMPSTAYDYSYGAMQSFLNEWVEKVALQEAFGTSDPRKNVFDVAIDAARDVETKNWLRAVKSYAYGDTIHDIWGRFGVAAGQLASAWHLANFASATKNLLSGMAFNVTNLGRFGIYGFFQVVPFRTVDDAVERGILVRDMMAIMADGEKMTGVAKAASWVATHGLKATGFNAAETWVRGVAMRGLESMLRHAIKHYKKNPRSSRTLRYMAQFQRMGIKDIEGLLQEDGRGEITDEYLRAGVNQIQGGYTYADVPVYMESPAGKVILKYRKWGVEQLKNFSREVVDPAARTVGLLAKEKVTVTNPDGSQSKVDVPRHIAGLMPMARWLILIAAAGQGEEWLLEKLFGMHQRTARLADVLYRFRQSSYTEFKELAEKIWSLHLLAGSMGALGGYIQTGMEWAGIVSKPPRQGGLEESIPALGPFLDIADAIAIAQEKGQFDMRDLHRFAQSISGVRVGEQFVAQRLRDVYGFQNRYAETIATRQDLAFAKGIQRRYRESTGLPPKPSGGPRPEKTELSKWKDPLDEALTIGDVEGAKQIIRDARAGMSPARWEMEKKNLIKHIKAKQPLQGLTSGEVSRAEFRQWIKANTTPYEKETLRRLDETYRRSAQRIGIGLEFKEPKLEDIMKFRRNVQLKLEPTEYLPSE